VLHLLMPLWRRIVLLVLHLCLVALSRRSRGELLLLARCLRSVAALSNTYDEFMQQMNLS
jgi:hypothetical protein